MNAPLSVEQLTVRHPGAPRPAITSVSLTVEEGEVVGLIGESGSGKSTLIKACLGLLPSEAGTISWRGERLDQLSREALVRHRRRMQPVFQDAALALDPRFTVEACLAEPLVLHGRDASRSVLEALLSQVKLAPELLPRLPAELSSGQRQRVAIARALALDPEVLLLDEPVSALDVSIQGQVLELLADLRRNRRLTLLLVSHELNVVRTLATRIAVLFAGRIVEQGPASAVLSAPRHPYTQALVGAGEAGRFDASIAPEPGCAFRQRCPLAAAACLETPQLSSDMHAAACFMLK